MTAPPYRVDWFPAGADVTVADHRLVDRHLVVLRDGSGMSLPLTALPGGARAVALLMANQTSFDVERKIVARLVELARADAAQAIVGVPTLGLTYARPVAESLGLSDFVALGYSRKFWYDEALSQPTVSSTSPEHNKRLYLDPALLTRVQGKRAIVLDDVLNTGNTMAAAIELLRKAQVNVTAVLAVLSEGWQWHTTLSRIDPTLPARVRVLGHIPIFRRTSTGWAPLPETEAGAQPLA